MTLYCSLHNNKSSPPDPVNSATREKTQKGIPLDSEGFSKKKGRGMILEKKSHGTDPIRN